MHRGGTDQRGSLTLWLLGLVVVLLFLGGLSLDLWRAFNQRRALAGLVDAAAIAGASAVDEQALRDGGAPRLDPARAEQLAWEHLRPSGEPVDAVVVATAQGITVRAAGTVQLTLLGVLMPGRDGIPVSVQAVSGPRGSDG